MNHILCIVKTMIINRISTFWACWQYWRNRYKY